MTPAGVGTTLGTPLPRSALAGLSVGAVVALALTGMSFGTSSEGREGIAILASLIAMPATLFFDALDWGHWASQWTAFIIVAIPANGAVLGLAAGIVAKAGGWRWRGWAAVLSLLWLGSFFATTAWAQTH